MPKPPTAQRGRPARVAPAPALPEHKPWLRRFIPAPAAVSAVTTAERAPARRRQGAGGHERGPRSVVASSPVETAGAEASWSEDDPASRLPLGMSRRAALSTLLCVAGLGMSIYLTIVHYANYVAACVGGVSIISCQTVLHSAQSVIFGIPVPLLGLAFFVPMLALCSPWGWRSANRYVAPARLLGAITGIGMVCYLVYTELFVIGKICLDCTVVHIVTLLLFVVVVTGWDEATAPARLAAEA